MPQPAFVKMNEEREAAGLAPAANPRNAAAGTIRTLEPNIVAQRRLDFYAYFLLQDGNLLMAEQSASLDALDKVGFRVNRHRERARGADAVLDFIVRAEKLREKLDYEIDGVVVKVNEVKLQKAAGVHGQGSALGHCV